VLCGALYGALRGAGAVHLGREARRLREAGARVVRVEAGAADVRAMGLNPMDRRRSRHVLETARASVAERLPEVVRDAHGLLARRARSAGPARVAA
jgi:NTE family protein